MLSNAATATSARRGCRRILLGTALWGWAVDEREAHALLDTFAAAGGRLVDAAVNYPINGKPSDFGRANSMIERWLRSRRPDGFKIFCKIGSVDNSGSAETALMASNVLLATELARSRFSDWLFGVGIHWDNREDLAEISETLSVFKQLSEEGFVVGFSGVARPDLYAAAAPELAHRWWIQVKENAESSEARARYEPHFPDATYIAYKINMGGVKKEEAVTGSSLDLRGIKTPPVAARLRAFLNEPHGLLPRPQTMNELALMMSWANPALHGVILGPRNVDQLTQSLVSWDHLNREADAHAIRRQIQPLLHGAG